MTQDFWTANGLTGNDIYDPANGSYGVTGDNLSNVGITDPGQQPPTVTVNQQTGPQNGNYQEWFQQLMGGANDQASLLSHKADLEAAGFHISPANASGEISKIQTPDGQWVRVIGQGEGHPVWIPQPTGNSGNPSTITSAGDYNPSAYGVPSNPYTSKPLDVNFGNLPGIPDSLKNPLVLPTWNDKFTAPTKPTSLQSEFAAPTLDQLQNSPGYQARLAASQQAQERSAAAKGSILSGGFQNALGKSQQDYASNEYGNLFNQSLATRQENVGEYQGDFTNSFNQYKQRYGEFNDANQTALAQRGQNENEYLNNTLNPAMQTQRNQYQQALDENARTLSDYLTNYGIGRQGTQDFLNQNNKTADRGLQSIIAGRPS